MAANGSGGPTPGPGGPDNPNTAPQPSSLDVGPQPGGVDKPTGDKTAGGHEILEEDSSGLRYFESDGVGRVFELHDLDAKADQTKSYAGDLLGRFKQETERIKTDPSLDEAAKSEALGKLNSDARDSGLVRWEGKKGEPVKMVGFIPEAEDWYRGSRIDSKAPASPAAAPPKAPQPKFNEDEVKRVAAAEARRIIEEQKAADVAAAAANSSPAPTPEVKVRKKSFETVLKDYAKVDPDFVVNRGAEVKDPATGEVSRKPITADQVKALVDFAELKKDPAALDAIAGELVEENVVGHNVLGDPASRNEVDARILGMLASARDKLGMAKYSEAKLAEQAGSGLNEEQKTEQSQAKRDENAQAYGRFAQEAGFVGPAGTAEYLAMVSNNVELEAWRLNPETFRLGQLDQLYQQRINEMAGADPALLEQLNRERIKAVQGRKEWFDEQNAKAKELLNKTILAANGGERMANAVDLSSAAGQGDLEDMALVRARTLGAGPVIMEDKGGGRWHWSKERRGPKVIVTYRGSSLGPNVIVTEQRLRSSGRLLSQVVSVSDQDIRHRRQWFNRWGETKMLPPKDTVARAREQHNTDKGLLYGDKGEQASKFWANTFKREYWSGFGTKLFRGKVYGGLYGQQDSQNRVNRGNWIFRLFGGRE